MHPGILRMFRTKSVFIRILSFFILIIFLTVILLGYISSEYTSSLLIGEVMDSNLLLIRQVRNDIDREIRNLDRITFQLSLQAKVKAALYSDGNDRGSDQILYGDIIGELSSIKVSNPAVAGIWLQLFNSGVVLSSDARYSEDFFFTEVYPYPASVEWNAVTRVHPKFVSLGRQTVKGFSVEQPVVVFARSVSVDDGSPQGIACINVDESVLTGMLSDPAKKLPSLTLVLDADGNVVLRSRLQSGLDAGSAGRFDAGDFISPIDGREGYRRGKIGGAEYLVMFTTSDLNGWRYVSIIPVNFIMEKSDRIRLMTAAAALLCLVLGMAVSYLLARRIYHPIREIISYITAYRLKRKEGSGDIECNELDFINRIIGYVYSENENLKDVFLKNIPVLREKFLYDVLDGGIGGKEFEETAAGLSMEFPFPWFSVVVFEKEDEATWGSVAGCFATVERRIDDLAREKFGLRTYSLRKGASHLATVINSSGDAATSELLHEFLKEIRAVFLQDYGLVLTVGVGNAYDDPAHIGRSLKDALAAARLKIVKGIGNITYGDELKDIPGRSLVYSVETETKLMNAVKAGDDDRYLNLLNEIIVSNISPAGTSPEIVENLFNALASTAVRTVYDIRASVETVFGCSRNIYRELLERHEIESKRDFIVSAFSSVSRYVRGRNQGQNQRIREKIETFIKSNYSSDLSLSRVGEVTGFSSAYLSSIFKDLFNESFVDYVNGIRLEQARKLLAGSELTIGQVASQVGFASANTFIKVFKKREGITPGQFREIDGP